jgi:2-keto-4-pentenoate hydratase/2-oxohepta-3-ene-1,7-dioic acid hydratase in catechol pathway
MILLTAITPGGPKLAAKLASGITIIEPARVEKASLPRTLQEALATPDGLDKIREFLQQDELEQSGSCLSPAQTEVRIGLPFRPRNLICIGLNYKDHATESGVALPKEPVVFAKLTSSVIGPRDPIVIPPDTCEVDYEAELAIVIGRACRGVSPAQALEYVAGYTCVNDVSARDFQRGDGQWVRAKSQDSFGPLGPYLVTTEDIPDPQALYIRCKVNEQLLQNSNTSNMIFGVRELIAFISRGITLQPGDVISTGTPPGVGFARKPPIFLSPGDRVEVEIQNLGKLENQVVAQNGP